MRASTDRKARRAKQRRVRERRDRDHRGRDRERRPRPAAVRGIVCAGRRGLELRPYPDDGSFRARVPEDAARPGDVVRARFEARGRVKLGPKLGRIGDPDLDFAALCDAHALPKSFPPAVLRELEEVEARGESAEERLDLRGVPFVTIDPLRARDHDDAVFASVAGTGFRLHVAIADVSAFVPAGGALDREARRRGNSVYLPDRVVPMLPERLSGDLCSLRPGEDRLALAVELAVGADGSLRRLGVTPARIRSRAKLAYEEAAAAMEGGAAPHGAPRESLAALAALAAVLRRRRIAEGSLDLELAEAEPVVDARGRVRAIERAPRTVAHRAIEEAMLAANRAVAELLVEARRPALHRVHESPDPAELAELEPVLTSLGLWPRRMRRPPGAEDLQGLAEATRERADAGVVHSLLVRAMKQARYADEPLGHFALGFERYVHFTSPIRRYADLVVHRAVKALLAGERPDRHPLAQLAEHLSLREREAARAEYQALDWKRAALLLPRIGESFEGRVSGVAAFGLFVTLDAVHGDGLLPLRSLPRAARLDLRRSELALGRERIRLGERLTVRLASVDPARGRFALALPRYSEAEPSRRLARRSHSG
jgi:ribonuclease R